MSLEHFSFNHQPGLKRDTVAHRATGAFLTEASNIILLGAARHRQNPPRHRAGATGQRALFATEIDWAARLQTEPQGGRLPHEMVRLRRYGLIIVD